VWQNGPRHLKPFHSIIITKELIMIPIWHDNKGSEFPFRLEVELIGSPFLGTKVVGICSRVQVTNAAHDIVGVHLPQACSCYGHII